MSEANNGHSKSIKVSDEIVKLIIDSDLKAGDKLPNEYELATRLDVGRSTIREAIKILTSRNILEIRRGAGTFISQRQGVVDDPLGFKFIKDKKKLALDLVEVRMIVEPKIALLAAQNATKKDILELETLCDEVEGLINNNENHLKKDIEFHTKIASSSKNLVMPNLIPIINSSITLFIDITNRTLKDETIITHREVFEAIKLGKGQEAHDAMFMHLMYNKRNISNQ
ncbi:DNA-binding FadR family transcriptional regulator [Natranaerovirga hydrolytica]|uniref:DNA-binding FadR family transcriptional regulator n=1 Tax=Natranaerovirga hydrolytica TaxID=680378 RepID=A0A4R1MS66_9FIRM|nr:FadR/GntR family transcriptional regulator [Natranaerovirga hydrolytica]TCK92763.1 DNA-binding FadR family transcriptional regulator [Natranaerovirga hydrolytica]